MKHDNNKVDISLIPPKIIIEIAEIFQLGAKKYGKHNWYNDIKYVEMSRTYNSIQRHLLAFWNGEDFDQESKKSHLLHAITQLIILHETYLQNGIDDRRFKNECK